MFCAFGTSALAPARHLVVFRPRSRHTYGFDPQTNFDLPALEFSSVLGKEKLQLGQAENCYWCDGVTDAELREVARRSILVHGAYSIQRSASTVKDAAAGLALRVDDVTVVDLAQPNMLRTTRDDLLAELAASCDAPSSCATSSAAMPWVLLRERDGSAIHIGRRVACGPAAGLGAPGLATGRRCYNGWLGKYALKSREHATPTAMEPEIAFVMANLARVSSGSRVLDPTCGSGSLLVSAAALGATHLVGIDQNASAFAGAADDFSRLGLPVPIFRHGDVLRPVEIPELSTEMYDAIISDPPYNLRAPVFVGGAQTSSQDPQPAADLTSAVLALAAATLLPGGRLVLFVPARGDEIDLALMDLLCQRAPALCAPDATLRLVDGRLQRFGTRRSRRAGSADRPQPSRGQGAFARWLVCLEKASGETPMDQMRHTASQAPAAEIGVVETMAASVSFVQSVQACGADWQQVLSMVNAEDVLDVYAASAAISIVARAGEWRHALELLDRVATPDLACFNAAFSACEKAASEQAAAADAARALLERMAVHGIPPTRSCFTATGRASMRHGDWQSALGMFDTMKERGVVPLYSDVKGAIVAATQGKAWARVAVLVEAACKLNPRASQQEWLWRTWSRAQLCRIHDELASLAVDKAATTALLRALTDAANDGMMPSFAVDGARAGYTLAHLPTRTRKVADTLRLGEPSWLAQAVQESMRNGAGIVSLGGGPGFDHVAISLMHAFECGDGPMASSLVLDYEDAWAGECAAVAEAVDRVLGDGGTGGRACKFDRCDITVTLDAPANRMLSDALPRTRLLIASYVVAENAISLEASDYGFFESLFRDAALGTTLLVLETTHRAFPGLVDAARRGAAVSGLAIDVECPYVTSNNGYSLLVRKRAKLEESVEESARERVHNLLERFARDAERHVRDAPRGGRAMLPRMCAAQRGGWPSARAAAPAASSARSRAIVAVEDDGSGSVKPASLIGYALFLVYLSPIFIRAADGSGLWKAPPINTFTEIANNAADEAMAAGTLEIGSFFGYTLQGGTFYAQSVWKDLMSEYYASGETTEFLTAVSGVCAQHVAWCEGVSIPP